MNKKLITYLFPVYNEEKNLDKLYTDLTATLKKVEDKYDFEIVCINDGSRDNSFEKLIELHNKDSRFKILNFSRNFGHQIAVTAGLDFAKGDAVIIMDADLQDPPEVSLELIQKWEEGYEVVYGQRRSRKDTFFKRLTAYMFYRVLDALSYTKIPKDTGDFRLMDRKVVDAVKRFKEKNRYLRGLVSYVGFKQTAVLFDRHERYAGVTNYPLKKMIKFAMDAITSFSYAPLTLVFRLGIILIVLTIGLSFIRLILDVFNSQFSTLFYLFQLVLFALGVNLTSIGILGTYIGRIYTEVLDRPLYIVSNIIE